LQNRRATCECGKSEGDGKRKGGKWRKAVKAAAIAVVEVLHFRYANTHTKHTHLRAERVRKTQSEDVTMCNCCCPLIKLNSQKGRERNQPQSSKTHLHLTR